MINEAEEIRKALLELRYIKREVKKLKWEFEDNLSAYGAVLRGAAEIDMSELFQTYHTLVYKLEDVVREGDE